MAWTKDKLSALSASERAQLYANAVSQDTDEGKALVALIEELGLPFSESGGITGDHPLVEAMRSVIFSDEGQRACIEAAESGLPALAGVDPMLAEKFGADYGAHNMTTNWAGSLVAELMRIKGYRMVGREAATPPGCVARSGELWE